MGTLDARIPIPERSPRDGTVPDRPTVAVPNNDVRAKVGINVGPFPVWDGNTNRRDGIQRCFIGSEHLSVPREKICTEMGLIVVLEMSLLEGTRELESVMGVDQGGNGVRNNTARGGNARANTELKDTPEQSFRRQKRHFRQEFCEVSALRVYTLPTRHQTWLECSFAHC